MCDKKEYDGWFKDVIEGKAKSFYPRRIRLLEIPGMSLLLYHSHKRAIVGEAKIVNFDVKDKVYHYWFERFVLYPNPVSLKLLRTDPRAMMLARRGRWRIMYLSSETVEEIRELSELSGESKERLRRELEIAKEESERRSFPQFVALTETKKLADLGLNSEVLKKTQEIFFETEKTKVQRGRSSKLAFYASLYLAYRSLGLPVRLKQIGKMGELSTKRLGRIVRLMMDELGIKPPGVTPREWILSSSKKLKVSQKTIKLALQMINDFEAVNTLRWRNPVSIAATAMYLGIVKANANVSQGKVAEAFGVSSVTLRNLARLALAKT